MVGREWLRLTDRGSPQLKNNELLDNHTRNLVAAWNPLVKGFQGLYASPITSGEGKY